MFKNKGKESNKANTSFSGAVSGATNTITAGTSVEGTINADTDIRVDGKLKGKLNCKGRVIIGAQGAVDGEISCQNAIIEGKFMGTLKVAEVLTVKDNAKVEGDIQTDKLKVDPGAVLNGNCSMGGQKLKSIAPKDKEAV